MFRKILIASVSALCLAGAAAAEDVKVSEIKVNTDLSAIKNAEAAKFYANLSTDLTNAIATKLTPAHYAQADKDGAKIEVNIDALHLSDTWSTLTDMSKSELVGTIKESGGPGNIHADGYKLSVAYNNVVAYLPQGTDVTALMNDSGQYYHAMVDVFADQVVKNLE